MPHAPYPARATYRIQANRSFGFERIADLASYLVELGVSHVYLSPVLAAVPNSQHGYDVIDHERVNPELGGEAAYERMSETLRAHGLQQLLDIVPNHMAIVSQNRLWWDVLENGPASHFAAFFDVDWSSGPDTRVLLPILGEHYVDAIHNGTVKLARRDAEFSVHYHEHHLPAAPRALGTLLRSAADSHDELAFLAEALENLPAPDMRDREATRRRQRDKRLLYSYLTQLLSREPALCARIDARIKALNADSDALDAFLEHQNWRLAHWHSASTDLGYRRFFDVNSLAGLRVEDAHVFERVHAVVLNWMSRGILNGIRIDHVDGLRDPQQYLDRLRKAAPQAWIVVEKILSEGETLPPRWPVDGTTGYEFIRLCDQLFVDPRGQTSLTQLERELSGADAQSSYVLRVIEAKLQILNEVLSSERERLIELAYPVLTSRKELRDCTRRTLSEAITAILVSYPVYRTYVRPGEVSETDRALITGVIASASELAQDVDPRVWHALERVLCLEWPGEQETELAVRVQQVTGAIMAKAIEDTLFYRHVRLVALNEVGGTPDVFGISLDEFHETLETKAAEAAEAQIKPLSMLSSATHDTKRGEDTRARLLALSEVPELWTEAVERWMELTASYRPLMLDSATEYFFYQTLVGAHPLSLERALPYMQKAVREKKRETSWIRPNLAYEEELARFIRSCYEDATFQRSVSQFVEHIAPGGYVTSLSRTLIKLTVQGVPDIYQGSELWDFSLVDPDNRAPVDFEARRVLLKRIQRATPEDALAEMEVGTPKLWLIWQVLGLRKRQPELFEGPYRRLRVDGPDAQHVVAYARGDALAVALPRFNARSAPKQRNAVVHLPPGDFQSALYEQTCDRHPAPVSELWARFPVALLVKK